MVKKDKLEHGFPVEEVPLPPQEGVEFLAVTAPKTVIAYISKIIQEETK